MTPAAAPRHRRRPFAHPTTTGSGLAAGSGHCPPSWSYARFSHVGTEDPGFGTQVCGTTAVEEYAVKATMSNGMTGRCPPERSASPTPRGRFLRRHIYWDNWSWIRQGALSLGGVAGFFGRGFSKTDEAMTKGMPAHV